MNIHTVKCARCKKEFVPGAEHIYKDNRKLFCSWNCFCAHRKDKEARKVQPMNKTRDTEMAKLFLGGASFGELSQKYNLSYEATKVAIRRGKDYLEDEYERSVR